jgi:hypothetical protein
MSQTRLLQPTRRSLLTAGASLAASWPPLSAAASPPIRIPDPPPGQATVVFYRKWEWPAAADSYMVHDGVQDIGRLGAGTYFVTNATPGLHTYWVRAERRRDMQLQVDADETYYVRFELDLGIVLYQPTLTPSEQRLFDQSSAHLKLAAPLQPALANSSAPALTGP